MFIKIQVRLCGLYIYIYNTKLIRRNYCNTSALLPSHVVAKHAQVDKQVASRLEAQEKEFAETKQLATSAKNENEKLRMLVKKKMQEVSEMKTKSEADLKALAEKHAADLSSMQ